MKTQKILNYLKNKKIIIYGAGKIGKRIYQSLLSFGFKIESFWDNNADKIPKFMKASILKPGTNSIPYKKRNEYIIIVTIFAKNISKNIASDLFKLGFSNVIYNRKIINSIIYQACKRNCDNHNFIFDLTTCHICPVPKDNNTCDIFNSYVTKKLAKGVASFSNKKERLIIPKIGILVSNKCTLTCKGCNHLRDLYKPGNCIEFTTKEILLSLNKIVESVDLINQITIVGGEAFLHPNLFEILEKILNLPKIGIVQIITNGTVIPKDRRLFNLMSHKKVIVEVSGYGDKIPKILQENVQKFLLELKKHKINYQYMNTLQWFDFGNFDKRPYTKKEHRQIYTSCCFISNDIFNGKLHKCSRSVFANYLGKIPDYQDDYIDLHKYSRENLRSKLIEYLNNKYPKVCLHCNGVSTVTHDVGFQVHKK